MVYEKTAEGTIAVPFDSAAFLGTWYCRLSVPVWFQLRRAFNVTATYSKNEDGTITVRNSEVFFRPLGRKIRTVVGLAKVVSPGHAQVSFDPAHVFWGTYLIRLFKEGDYMVVTGEVNDQRYGWLLTREKHSDITEARAEMKKLGADLAHYQVIGHE